MAKPSVYANQEGDAIDGYDPGAYHTQNKAIHSTAAFHVSTETYRLAGNAKICLHSARLNIGRIKGSFFLNFAGMLCRKRQYWTQGHESIKSEKTMVFASQAIFLTTIPHTNGSLR